MERLAGKVAIVTGSARGIGKSISIRFAREGANVVVSDLMPNMEDTLAEIKALGRKAISIKADVSIREEVNALLEGAIDAFQRVDILVNNAGIVRRAPFLEMTEADWDDVLNVDLKGIFLCTQAAARHMIKNRYGKIINISSVRALGSFPPDMVAYSSAKNGVLALTREAAKAFGRYGINVNAVAPGLILSGLSNILRTPVEVEALVEENKKTAVLGRAGVPEDVANLALFLASDESSFITGQVIACDGGRNDKM